MYFEKETKSWEHFQESVFLHEYRAFLNDWHTFEFDMIDSASSNAPTVGVIVSIITNPTSKVYEISEFWYVGLNKFPGTIV